MFEMETSLSRTGGMIVEKDAVTGAASGVHRISLAVLVAMALWGCSRDKPREAAPPVVDVATPAQRDVTLHVDVTGQISAINIVPLVARVQGYLQAIRYRDGAFVRRGSDLFVIEPSPYLAQLHQAEANLASTQAKAAFADLQARRYDALAKVDSTSRQQAEQTQADRDAAGAAVRQAKAALEQARITYAYTQVAAPFDGLVSAHEANLGALVGGSGPTQLATIVQLDPIWVNFNIPEQQAGQIRAEMSDLEASRRALPVVAGLQNETGYPHAGTLDYVAPTIDQQTGTLRLRALFRNPRHELLPGNFVRVRVQSGISKKALLVPETALGETQGSRTLMIVDANNRAQQRKVVTGFEQAGLVVITSGLLPDDRVIVNGLQYVEPGKEVRPHRVAVDAAARGAKSVQ